MLPATLAPMEPISCTKVPEGDEFLHSVKWDGVRQLVFIDHTGVRIQNRRLHDRTATYPELRVLAKIVRGSGLVLDGEIIALDSRGKPNFQQVMKRDFVRDETTAKKLMLTIPVSYMIFDLLYHHGEPVMHLPLIKRLELLQEVIPSTLEAIQLVPVYEDGKLLFTKTREFGLEGVVSKEKDGLYYPGRKHKTWVKVKHYRELPVVVGGFTTKEGLLNSLLVGAYQDDRLIYLGRAATGLSREELLLLRRELPKLKVETSPFANFQKKDRSTTWVAPVLSLRVRYAELTEEGELRHPTILGFLSVPPETCRL